MDSVKESLECKYFKETLKWFKEDLEEINNAYYRMWMPNVTLEESWRLNKRMLKKLYDAQLKQCSNE